MKKRIIIIKHVTGEHRVEIDPEEYDTIYNGIQDCIKGKINCAGVSNGDRIVLYPAELLRNSVIIIEPSDLESKTQNNLKNIATLI